MKLIIGSDHAGFNLKKKIKGHLVGGGHDVEDAGTHSTESCNYAEIGLAVAERVASGEFPYGILICGTGVGMSMAANHVPGARAASCTNEYLARMSRAHNDANILCLGERVTGPGLALAVLDAWLATEFEGGRHRSRIDTFDRR